MLFKYKRFPVTGCRNSAIVGQAAHTNSEKGTGSIFRARAYDSLVLEIILFKNVHFFIKDGALDTQKFQHTVEHIKLR
jgi:hypothetical protein